MFTDADWNLINFVNSDFPDEWLNLYTTGAVRAALVFIACDSQKAQMFGMEVQMGQAVLPAVERNRHTTTYPPSQVRLGENQFVLINFLPALVACWPHHRIHRGSSRT
jgi:hypothetical protein